MDDLGVRLFQETSQKWVLNLRNMGLVWDQPQNACKKQHTSLFVAEIFGPAIPRQGTKHQTSQSQFERRCPHDTSQLNGEPPPRYSRFVGFEPQGN